MAGETHYNVIDELDATLVFKVAYDGEPYSGFAEQPGQTTVAGELRRAIETLLAHGRRCPCRRPVHQRARDKRRARAHAPQMAPGYGCPAPTFHRRNGGIPGP